jgi:hypothetical protein
VVRLFVISAAFAMTIAAPVIAAPTPAAVAEGKRLFEEGRTLAKQGDFVAACDRFTRSLELDPQALGTELNLADCNERQGHLRKAWQMFTTAATEAGEAKDDRAGYARDRATALESKLTAIVIKVASPQLAGLAITVGGLQVHVAAEIRDRIEPGSIEVVATAPGRAPYATSGKAVAGGTLSIEIPALEMRTSGTPVPVGVEIRRRSRVYMAGGLAGVALAAAVTSVAFVSIGRNVYNTTADGPHCTKPASGGVDCDDIGTVSLRHGQHLADIGTGFAIGSGAVLAVAAIVYFTAPRDRVAITPMVGGSTGVAVVGRF